MTANAKNGFLLSNGRWQNHYLKDPISVLVVNLMPTKEVTERQFLESFNNLNQDIEFTFLYLATHHFKNISYSAIAKAYASLDDVESSSFDGLIITGAPVEQLNFHQVDYWEEFRTICDWAKRHTKQSLLECWAALGGLYNDYQLNKQQLPQKLFGIYQATSINEHNRLSHNFHAIKIPQSRHSTPVIDPNNLPDDLEVIATNKQIGPLIYYSPSNHRTYITGHPEYESDTLAKEYYRDLKKRLPIQEPHNYFANVEIGKVNYSWQQSSIQIYQNWLNTFTQQKVGTLV
ncbi:homoserine O-acetyltransferase/O-succinyltransferase family protein [Limosilactobacillus fastidiosus]|uniref:homoserine O-acetyltransferase/O-succinyltransferase family protein n=1 Tax=Limosilactobacillus fastidiosus TaxID=2759855 RepID=UPI001E3E7AC8|nr:homoserine O-succinyltransferase [Limosilactobacillus fastidiosus]MCD7083490.1 homoserine O-succinyltransferase [Limosilactobacillus fastidiosus]